MKPPAFQFYPSDFLASTAEMSAEEVGVHIRLLCNQWLRGGLPNDDERLRSMAGQCLPSSVAYAKSRYKVCSDGMIRHQRMEEERVKQDNYRKKQAEYGKKRWDNEATLNQPSRVASGSLVATLCPPSPSPSPSLTSPPKRERRTFTPPTLEEWTAYGLSLSPPFPQNDIENTHNHYSANGWLVGKNPMKDWKAAMRTCWGRWKQNPTPQFGGIGKPAPAPFSRNTGTTNEGQTDTREYCDDDCPF